VEQELELARSLCDRDGLLAHVDIEHVHFDRPWETFAFPERAFALQQPVAAALEASLARRGIVPLHALTGRGHHWAWSISRHSPAFAALAGLVPPGVRASAAGRGARCSAAGEVTAERDAAARFGLGLVAEGVGHEILRAAAPVARVPVQLTAVAVGPGPRGREIVSVDLSPFGDPLPTRTARVPFSIYLKGWRLGRALAPPRALDPLAVVIAPAGTPLAEALAARRPELAAELASRTRAAIPDGSAGTLRLVEAYRASPLAAFHCRYYACEPEPRERWRETYDRLDLRTLPPCAAELLARPNDAILRPAALQHLVRVLLALDWHPRHVAGLVRSKLEGDFGWQPGVHFFDAELRADFYVRLFAGLVATGADGMVDLNCISAQEKWLCPQEWCGWNLATLRAALRQETPRWATGR
jgi:hypothetical protein